MITNNGERNPNLGKSKAEQANRRAQEQGRARTAAERQRQARSQVASTPKVSQSSSTGGTLTSVKEQPKETSSVTRSSSSSSSSNSERTATRKKTLSQAEKSAALNDLMDRATIGSSRTYGLSFQSSNNQKYNQRRQTLLEQATKNGYAVGQNTKAAQSFRSTVNQKLGSAILSGKSPSEARSAEQQRLKKSAAAQKTVLRDQEKGRNRTVSELDRQIKAIDKEIGASTQKTGRPDMQKVAERNQLSKQKRAVGNDYGVLESLGRSVEAGAGSFNSAVTSTLNAGRNALMELEAIINGGWDKESRKFVKGDSPITASLFQPVADLNDYTKETTAGLQQSAAERWSRYGKAGDIANQLTQGTVAAVPNAILAMATAGGSAAATLSPEASGLTATVANAVQKLSKDPMYWTSFIQSFGNGYEEAIEKGATQDEALLATLLSSAANAIVEIGGGVEQLPRELREEGLTSADKIRKWVSSSLDEGKEEVIQGMIERLVNKAVYDQDAPWFSMRNEDAVINPRQSLQEGAMGAAIGGILGGGQMLAQGIAARGQRIVDPTASPMDQAILDSLQGVQTPENVTQVREPTDLDNIIMETQMQLQSGIGPDVATNKPKDVKNLLNATKEQISRFIQNAFNKQNQYQYLKISDVSPELAETLRAAGIEVDGYAHALRDNDIRHVDSSHGTQSNDKYKVTADMLGDVQNVIDNYDALYRGFDTRFGNPTVVYEKRMGNRTFYVEEVMSDGVLGTKQMIVTGENSKPSFLKKYTEIASVSDDTDVPAQSGSTGQSPPGNHVPDAPYNTSYNSNVAQSVDSVNRENVGDIGAMQSRFESEPKQSQTQSNTIGAMEEGWNVPEEQRSPIMYDTVSEEKSLDNARLRLAQDYEGEKAELRQKYNWSGEEVDMGMTILDNYRRVAEETGDWTQYSEWRKTVSEHGTAAGQALQAYAKYSRQTGGGIVADAQAFLEESNLKKKADTNAIMDKVSSLAERYDAAVGTGNKDADVNVDDLLNVIQDASKARQTGTLIGNKTPGIVEWAMKRIANYARAEAQGDGGENLDFLKTFASDSIYNIAADAQKASAGEKFKTYRRQNMLSKVATVMRNLVSNNVFDPIDSISRNMSVPIDMLLSKLTGTRSVAWDASWFSKAKRKGSLDGLAKACMEVGLDVDTSGGTSRYGTTSNRTFKMSDGVMSKLMSTWEAYEGYTLNATDEFQKGGIEAEVQRGIDKLYEKGKIKDDSLRNAGEQEALYRTFQDTNALSGAVTGFRSGINKAHIGDVGAGDIALTFAQVPANLAARAVEYSPAGGFVVLADILNAGHSAIKGEFTAAQQAKIVQGAGRALNGSAVIGIAAVGALRGWLKVSGDDDDADKNALDKTYGLKGTQLNIDAAWRDLNGGSTEWQEGDHLVSIGFLEPINAQFTTGALIANDILEAQENGEKLTFGQTMGDSMLGAYQAVMDMPLMSDLQELAQNYQYSDGTKFYQKAGDAAQKYLAGQATSLIPNALRGVAQGLDDTERDAYTSDNVWQQALDNAKASIPGIRETLPAKKDVWGNDIKNEGGFRNFMNRNINPGDVTTYRTDAVSSELDKISEESGESLYPQRYAPRSIKVGDEDVKLTDAQRDTYQETYGSEYYKAAQSLMQSEGYKDLPATVKAEALRQARKIAEDAAKEAAGVGYESDEKWINDLKGKSGEEVLKAILGRAVDAEKYISDEAKNKLGNVQKLYDSLAYAGVSDDLKESARKKAAEYFQNAEKAKFGYELSEEEQKLDGKNQKTLAEYFLDEAVKAKYKDANEDGTNRDELLQAYNKNELNDRTAIAVLSAREVDAYQKFGKAAGVTPQMMLEASSAHARMHEVKDIDGIVTSSVREQYDDWLESKNLTEEQKKALRMGFYGDTVDTYNKLVEDLDLGNITVGEAKQELTPTYQYGWTHNVSSTGVQMRDYISSMAAFENAPSEEERDKMGFNSKWEWFCNELNKNTDLTKEQKYAIAISTDRSMAESTKKKIANKLGTAYVAPSAETNSPAATVAAPSTSGVSTGAAAYSANSGGYSGGWSSGTEEKSQVQKAYERFGMAAGATEAMYQEAKQARDNISTVYDMDGNVVRSAEDQFDSWLERRNWTQDQKDAVRAGFYSDTVKNLQYLSSELREGNISVASAKSELSAKMQTGWTRNVMDTGAAMADYIDAWAYFKEAPNADEREAQGFGTKWAWFCNYLNQTDMTAEQKYAFAVSVQDYADSTKRKIQKYVGWDGVSSAEPQSPEETYDLRTDDGYRAYLSLLLKRTSRYEAKDGSVWTLGSNGDVIARTKDGRQLRVRAVLGKNGFEDIPGNGYTVGSKAGELAYKMMQNGVMKTWQAPDGWTWKLVRGEIIAEKNGTKIPVRMAG